MDAVSFSKRFLPTIIWALAAQGGDVFFPSESILVQSEANAVIFPFCSIRCVHRASVNNPHKNRPVSLRKSGDAMNVRYLRLKAKIKRWHGRESCVRTRATTKIVRSEDKQYVFCGDFSHRPCEYNG